MSKLRDYACGRIEIAQSEPLTQRKGITETVPLSSKAPKARKRVTEAVEPANGRSIAEYVRSGITGHIESSGPIPRWVTAAGSIAAQVASQLLHLGREPGPVATTKLAIPDGWIWNEEAPEFCAIVSEALGAVWRPTLAVLSDWHRNQSQFRRPLMEKRVFYDRNVPTIAFSKAGLLDLCRHKVSQLLAQPQPEAQPTAKPQRPSLAEQQQIREADAAARRTPGEILARENAAYLAQQQQAEAEAEPAKT